MASQLSDKRRVEALFKALASDYLLREQFVTDPAQILSEYVTGKRLKPEEAAAANHLVYSVMSNPGMARWLASYGSRGVPDDDTFLSDFARALARDGDEPTHLAVLRAASEPRDVFSVQANVLKGLISAQSGGRFGGVFAGTQQSSPGTEISSPGTEVSLDPGRVFAGTEVSSPGTEISPGTGTEQSPGQVFNDPGRVFAGTEVSSPGTEISPGTGTEQSPGQVFNDPGRVFAGTEQSSPGTEISPGPGTDKSPGQVFNDPGRVFAGTEQSSPGTEISPGPGTDKSPGQVFNDPGRVFAGTEQSSPGTEISPGPGTDKSPGKLGGIDFEVTLQALQDFANELRQAGALNVTRFR